MTAALAFAIPGLGPLIVHESCPGGASSLNGAQSRDSQVFAIDIVDEETGRGVPLVELETTSKIRYYTDSNGLVALDEPELMGRKVWFNVRAHGYEFAPDGFGFRGAALDIRPGGSARLGIKRLNIAERLYRLTGHGIYRDTVLARRKPPIDEGVLNGEITGQDSVLAAVYRGRIYWFWGDTNRLSAPLGNFSTTGATSDLPERGGLDPAVGVNYRYFVGADGFARRMIPIRGPGVVWASGLAVLPDENGRERMVVHYQRRMGLGKVLEQGIAAWDDGKEEFEKYKEFPPHLVSWPFGHAFPVGRYLHFTAPYPSVRVKADWKSYTDPAAYESFTCLERPGVIDRDREGRPAWSWHPGIRPLGPREQEELVTSGRMKSDQSPHRLEDRGKPITLNSSSVAWNEFRKRYCMIGSQVNGATVLGETWYAEAREPEGPWVHARKVVTHDKPNDPQDFYNPAHHPFFDQNGGRVIYFQGTFTNTFSGNPRPTPRYDYNQIMYRLDLSDPRLRMPD